MKGGPFMVRLVNPKKGLTNRKRHCEQLKIVQTMSFFIF